MTNKPNAVLVASSNWRFIKDDNRQAKVTKKQNTQPYAVVFGREVRISRNDVKMCLDNNFKIVYK